MEPWPPSHGYMTRAGEMFVTLHPLQWSHGFPAMDTWDLPPARPPCATLLQWSHGLPAMDTRRVRHPDPPAHPASMEPWPFSHGYVRARWAGTNRQKGFNGAMAFQPWIRGYWSSARLRYACFNGAMAFQPWIRRVQEDSVAVRVPLMEP